MLLYSAMSTMVNDTTMYSNISVLLLLLLLKRQEVGAYCMQVLSEHQA